jgi:hypothetical protein
LGEDTPAGSVVAVLEQPKQVNGEQLQQILEVNDQAWPPFDSIIHLIDPAAKPAYNGAALPRRRN